MRIRKLDLFGFKSFPDRTIFEFGSGISCVVGPNGSGKSNVVDALRWVIGEQSAKSLRGSEMSDVIFAGSAARSPVGFAEVNLMLAVDGGEPFPGDFARFEELEVGRRLYRDGTSEYLINRVKCRRRDIVDLFLDTGVGANLYSFIAQGQVDRIVSQSPNERRSLIDEAAGITRFKARREEATARLTATAAQLDRAADVSDEMGKRIRSLERQVLKAGRFRRARAKIRQREIVLGVVKYGALAGDRRALRHTLRHTRDDAGALKRSVDRLTIELETRSAEVESVREALQKWRDEAAELEAQRREAEGARRLQTDRHRELLESGKRAVARQQAATTAVENAVHEQTQTQAELASLHQQTATDAGLQVRMRREGDAEALDDARRVLLKLRDAEAARVERVRGLREELDRSRTRIVGLRSEPVPEDPTPSDDPEPALVARLEEERSAVEASRTMRAAAREALTTAEQEDATLAAAFESEMQAWRARRSEVDAARAAAEAWFETERLAAAASVERQRAEQLRAARERASAWMTALREQHAAAESTARATHSAEIDAVRSAQSEQLDAVSAREDSAVAAVEASLDHEALSGARDAFHLRREEAESAEIARREADDEAAAALGHRRALEAQFDALEARRKSSIPEAWAGRSVLADALDADDPIRVARPDLLALPVVEVADLAGQEGRGVLKSTVRWRVADTAEEAIALLAEHGPPVVSRDGRLRVDVDGLVELGERPADRWAEVRDALADARQVAVSLDEDARAATTLAEAAREAADTARDTLESVEAALSSERDRRLRALRAELDRARKDAVAQASEAESTLTAAFEDRLRSDASARQAAIASASALRDQALDALEPPASREPALRDELARRLPEPVGDPPQRGRTVDLAGPREVLEKAELALERAEAATRETAAELERVREGRRAEDRARAEREAARQARLAEADRLERRTEEIDAEIERSTADPALQAAETSVSEAEEALEVADAAWREVEARGAALRERIAAAEASVLRANTTIDEGRAAVDEARAEAEQAALAATEALSRAETAESDAGRLAVQRAETLTRVERERDRLEKLSAEAERVRANLESSREKAVRAESEQGELEQRVQNLQLEIEALRKRLGDRYQVSLPGLLDRLFMRKRLTVEPDESVTRTLMVREVELEAVEPLSITLSFADDVEGITAMVAEVEELRTELQKLGEVNLAAEGEYVELDERYRDLQEQTADLEASVKTIRAAIAKMNRTCRERFRDAYDRVNEAFQLAYPKLVGGGDARLALTDEEDLLETGVDIFVRPPGKRLQNLTLLSGGEKAMTAIALLLALFKVKPSPFCVLDEVDAPLDEANGARFNDMVREMSRMSQFIVITHNRKTMECADVLYGVTMAHPGVSTLVSVALDAGADA